MSAYYNRNQLIQRSRQQVTRRRVRRRFSKLLVHAVLMILSLTFLAPLLVVVSASFSSENAIARNGYALFPQEFTTFAYQYLFTNPGQLLAAYGVTIAVTLIGTTIGVLIMALLAYVLARKDFFLRRGISFAVFFTLLFNGGMVPLYILVTQYLHLQDTLLSLILPLLVVPWFVLLLRGYFLGLPHELLEAAKIDGAGEWHIFFRIVVPLSGPALATVGLFSALAYWNDWYLSLLFINDPHLFSLQYLLYKISTNLNLLQTNPQLLGIPVPSLSIQMAIAVLAIGPIVFAFLFLQRYFVRGITLGGVKGG